ncbi:MAG: hypothetical protein J3K34DRAFT_521872 [Monoraphidium minutum]|nr:MAG: hypothetical protein J3K34DRAFT_521872 [Monoraphidium minutum]
MSLASMMQALALALPLLLAAGAPPALAAAPPAVRRPGAGAFADAPPPDFSGPGPCAVAADAGIPVTLPPASGCGGDCGLDLHLAAPAAPAPGAAPAPACPFAAPHPVLGVAVVRYDIRLLDLVPAGVQAAYVPYLLAALNGLNTDPASQWFGRLDLSRLGAAGHSRGGKVAALHLASPAAPLFSAAYLIDPVDSEGGAGEPSAVEALRGRGKRFGISAAGIVGSCNPPDRTKGFWEVAAPGSWRETLRRGGHAQFCNISSWVVERALDMLCGAGGDSHEAVMALTLPPMVAWLSSELGVGAPPAPPPRTPVEARQRQQQEQAQHSWRHGLWRHGAAQAWRDGARLAGAAPVVARRALQSSGGGPAAAAVAGVLDEPFWDWVDREEQLGEIDFDVNVAAAALPWALPKLQLPWARPAAPPNPVQAERDELISLLLGGGGGGGGGGGAARASDLVDALIAAQLPFDEALLGGGPWVVAYTRGAPQLWKATWQTGKAVSGNAGNEASQAFDPDGRSALNKAEYWGGAVYVTAGGSYAPLDDGAATPKAIRADIAFGSLHAFGRDIPLPIRGSGRFEVMYLDDTLRVFRSGGSISVQVKKSELQRLRSQAG